MLRKDAPAAIGALTYSRPTARGLRVLRRGRVFEVADESDGAAEEGGPAVGSPGASEDRGLPGLEAIFPHEAIPARPRRDWETIAGKLRRVLQEIWGESKQKELSPHPLQLEGGPHGRSRPDFS